MLSYAKSLWLLYIIFWPSYIGNFSHLSANTVTFYVFLLCEKQISNTQLHLNKHIAQGSGCSIQV